MSFESDWKYRQSAVVPFLKKGGALKVVLVTSSSKKQWVIPKGIIEPHLSPEDSAAKEALEEAGVIGVVSRQVISEYEYRKWGGTCHVRVYPLAVSEVLDDWEEMKVRERIIVDLEEAIRMIKPVQKEALKRFRKKEVRIT